MQKYSSTLIGPDTLDSSSQDAVQKVVIIQPYEAEQILLAENAFCIAVRTYLRMCKVNFTVKCNPNAEFMSPCGAFTNLPFFSVDKFFGSELKPLIKILEERQISLSEHLSAEEKMDMRTHLTLVEDVFTSAELYFSFLDDEVYKKVTYDRIASVYPKILGFIQNFRKKRSVIKQLEVIKYASMSSEEVLGKVDQLCAILEHRLMESPYLCGKAYTELDAAVFGHIFVILSTPLPNKSLQNMVKKYPLLLTFCKRIEEQFYLQKGK